MNNSLDHRTLDASYPLVNASRAEFHTEAHKCDRDTMPSEASSVLGGDVRLRSGIQESSGPNYNK